MSTDYESAIQALEATGNFRVLRRLGRRAPTVPPSATVLKRAIFLDVETTGLDPARDEVIELAMVPFTYGEDGTIYEVGEAFQAFRQPTNPIPPEITELTGITNEMVAGRSIDPADVAAFAASAVLIVAHNAVFDRGFAERLCDVFTTKAWACSVTQIPWKDEGFPGTRLAYLASHLGFFFDGHRAVEDCLAAVELLSRPLPKAGMSAFSALLAQARQPSWRIWAEQAPFDLRNILKARGYRWNDGTNGKPRSWWIDVANDQRDAELQFLQREIYQAEVDLSTVRITAFDRFSDRV